jgi:CRP/FNR family transcriptional regulator, cyclic AMP receptor protein
MNELLALAADYPTATFTAGAVLIDEGSDANPLFVLESGTVTIERGEMAFARIDSPGAVFGEMAVVLRQAATATVRALDDVVVRVVHDPEMFLLERPGAALYVLRMTATRLDGLTQYLVDVKEQFADAGGHLGLVAEILDTLVHHQAPPTRTGSARDPESDHQH